MTMCSREYHKRHSNDKRNQTETLKFKNTTVKIKNLLKGLNSTFEVAEEIIS